jgi:gas vesicle structural protein
MPVERAAGGTSLVDVLDRVLDKGIVIDAWVRVSLVGIDLITVEARVVVASIDTYLKYAEAVGQVSTASRPAIEAPAAGEVFTTNEDLLERVPRTPPPSGVRRKRP